MVFLIFYLFKILFLEFFFLVGFCRLFTTGKLMQVVVLGL